MSAGRMLAASDQVVRHVRVDGQDVAYSVVGEGSPVVVGGWWCSHLTLNWEDPLFRGYISRLAERHSLIRYDRPGSGVSDPGGRAPANVDEEVAVLAGLLDVLGLDRVDVLGASSGAATAAAFAAAQPDRVAHLVLYGAFARGEDIAPPAARSAMLAAVLAHWGLGSRLLADVFVPGATSAEREEFASFQRLSASPQAAHASLAAAYRIDISVELASLRVPTTVLHRRDDRAVAYPLGVDVARRLPHAHFVALDGEDHFPWRGGGDQVADETLRALGHQVPRRPAAPGPEALSPREREVLELVAGGLTDLQIAERLVLSPHTVHRHVANARTKLGVRSRAAAARAVTVMADSR